MKIDGKMMREVTEKEFFSLLYADKRDIMPTIVSGYGEHGFISEWRTQSIARVLFGVSNSGRNGVGRRWLIAE